VRMSVWMIECPGGRRATPGGPCLLPAAAEEQAARRHLGAVQHEGGQAGGVVVRPVQHRHLRRHLRLHGAASRRRTRWADTADDAAALHALRVGAQLAGVVRALLHHQPGARLRVEAARAEM